VYRGYIGNIEGFALMSQKIYCATFGTQEKETPLTTNNKGLSQPFRSEVHHPTEILLREKWQSITSDLQDNVPNRNSVATDV
jgi:hypothetical protein